MGKTADKYAGAKWGVDFHEDIIGEPRADEPALEEMGAFLRKLEREHPERVSVEEIGRTVAGNEILMATVTDTSTADDGKQIALFLGGEHGNERSSTVALLRVLEWLVTPEAAETRSRQKVFIIPCVNADGYDTLHTENMNGVNLYADYSLSGEPTQPESRAVWRVIERYRPEVVGSCHGHWRKVNFAAFENCQGSYGTSRYDRTHSRLFAEEVSRACEAAGYPQDRMEEDGERILSWLPEFENHSFRSGDCITPGVYAYNRFHSLVFSMEIMHAESGLTKIRKILELGNRPWRYERLPGYPVRVILPPMSFAVAAYGRTAAELRRSRVELWQSNDVLARYMLPHIEDEGFMGFAVSMLREDRDGPKFKTVSDALDHFASDGNIAAPRLREAFGYRLKAWTGKVVERPSADPVPLAEIKHGISLRARLIPGSRVTRVLINGREARRSEREGYESWTPENSYTFVQINVPGGSSIAAVDGRLTRIVCTLEYEPGRLGRAGGS